MKVRYTAILISLVAMFFSCSKNAPSSAYVATQKISGSADCEMCSDHWKWSNGIASIDWFEGAYHYSARGFSFKTKVSGELTLEAKIKDTNHNSWVELLINDQYVTGSGYLKNKDYEKVSLGHVEENTVVWIIGSNIILKNIMISDVNTPDSQWDF